MNFFIWTACFMAIPAICSAHSGTLVNAFSNYLPLIMPMVVGAVATCRNYIKNFFARIFERFKSKD